MIVRLLHPAQPIHARTEANISELTASLRRYHGRNAYRVEIFRRRGNLHIHVDQLSSRLSKAPAKGLEKGSQGVVGTGVFHFAAGPHAQAYLGTAAACCLAVSLNPRAGLQSSSLAVPELSLSYRNISGPT